MQEILFAFSLRAEQFEFAQKLRCIHAPTAAVHQLLFPELVKSDVVLTNAREVHGPVVAESVMALIFALAKKIPQTARLQQKRFWGQDAIWNDGPRPLEIAGNAWVDWSRKHGVHRRAPGVGRGDVRNCGAGTYGKRNA